MYKNKNINVQFLLLFYNHTLFVKRFEFFYEKTGVTGPYMFGTGLITYLCSKEIYVMEHEFYTGISLGIICLYATKKLGPHIAKYLDKEVDVSLK